MDEPLEEGVDVRLVSVGRLRANEHNPNDMKYKAFNLLVEHIKQDGRMNQPVLVVPIGGDEDHDFEIVDGEHRWRAAQAAGLQNIAVVVVNYDQDQSKMRSISFNQIKGEYIPLKMAKLLADLQDRHSAEEIQRMTGIQEDEFKSLAELLEVTNYNFDDSPIVSSVGVDRPIEVNIFLLPDDHNDYKAAMIKEIGRASCRERV